MHHPDRKYAFERRIEQQWNLGWLTCTSIVQQTDGLTRRGTYSGAELGFRHDSLGGGWGFLGHNIEGWWQVSSEYCASLPLLRRCIPYTSLISVYPKGVASKLLRSSSTWNSVMWINCLPLSQLWGQRLWSTQKVVVNLHNHRRCEQVRKTSLRTRCYQERISLSCSGCSTSHLGNWSLRWYGIVWSSAQEIVTRIACNNILTPAFREGGYRIYRPEESWIEAARQHWIGVVNWKPSHATKSQITGRVEAGLRIDHRIQEFRFFFQPLTQLHKFEHYNLWKNDCKLDELHKRHRIQRRSHQTTGLSSEFHLGSSHGLRKPYISSYAFLDRHLANVSV